MLAIAIPTVVGADSVFDALFEKGLNLTDRLIYLGLGSVLLCAAYAVLITW